MRAAMRLDRGRCALVLVDYQARLLPAIADGEAVLQEAIFIAGVATALGVPVVGTEQNPEGLGSNVATLRALCAHTLAKRHFDATADGLVEHLHEHCSAPSQVVVAGCEAHVCLLLTALGLHAAGLQVAVVPTACGSRSRADKALALQRLAMAGVLPISAETLAFEWLQSCDDPAFRSLLQRVKARPLTP